MDTTAVTLCQENNIPVVRNHMIDAMKRVPGVCELWACVLLPLPLRDVCTEQQRVRSSLRTCSPQGRHASRRSSAPPRSLALTAAPRSLRPDCNVSQVVFNVLKKGNIMSALRGDRIGTRVDGKECLTWECVEEGGAASAGSAHAAQQAGHHVVSGAEAASAKPSVRARAT